MQRIWPVAWALARPFPQRHAKVRTPFCALSVGNFFMLSEQAARRPAERGVFAFRPARIYLVLSLHFETLKISPRHATAFRKMQRSRMRPGWNGCVRCGFS